MKRNHSQRGRYSKNKGAAMERKTAKILTKWAQKSFGKTAKFGRTLSSGASANNFINPSATLLGDVFPQSVPGWNADIECKFYNSTSIRRYYEGTTRLASWLEECTRDCRRHTGHAIPMLVTHILRFRDMLMLPYNRKLFRILTYQNYPCWTTLEKYTVKRTGHVFRFLVILTDLQSLVKALSCKKFIQIYAHTKWDILNRKYTKHMTHQFLQQHSRAEMSRATASVSKTLDKAKK